MTGELSGSSRPRYIQSFFSKRGIKTERINNNIIARSKKWTAEQPTILLNSHHDTVKPASGYTKDPFNPEITDGILYGLGSNDAGGSLVALIATFLHLYDQQNLGYNLIFVASAEEEISGKKLFHPLETLRLFDGDKQSAKFHNKREQLAGWVRDAEIADLEKWNAAHGGFIMKNGGWLDSKTYLQVVRKLLAGRYRVDAFSEKDLVYIEGGVSWKEITAKRVILCQGARAFTEKGLFSSLNHRSAKGEILTVKIPKADQGKIINRNGWLIPIGNERWRVGANYEWEDMDGKITQAGRDEIERKLRNLTDKSFEVIEHCAGVRPIMRKSQPYVGHHPHHPEVSFFNGLGSKGVTTAPSVARHFADHLVTGSQIDVDLSL